MSQSNLGAWIRYDDLDAQGYYTALFECQRSLFTLSLDPFPLECKLIATRALEIIQGEIERTRKNLEKCPD